MAQIVKLRRSATTGNKPTTEQLELGELAMNTYDGKIYFEKSGSAGESIEEILTTNTQISGSLIISGSSHNITGSLELSGSLKLPLTVRDYTNSTGSLGQILQVTANGAIWVDNVSANTGDGRTAKQTFASATTWSFNHNLSEQYPVIELYDNNNQVIIPSTITATNTNNLVVTFAIPVAGVAVATVGGKMGPQGPVGVQGANGFIGVDGAQGAQGIQGAKGDQGLQGNQGTKGDQGYQGAKGDQGYQGAQGAQGAQGFQGAQGDQGYQGAQGNQGYQGAQGAQGFQGFGFQGDQGFQGAKGDQGFQGAKGDQGFQGFQGNQGATGSQGAVSSSARNVNIFTATAGQTTFTVPGGYTIGLVDVFWNGVKQTTGVDYTASNGTTVVLANAAAAGDTVEIDNYLGEIGSQGNQGATGVQGGVGSQGATGSTGFQGNQGPTGAQGIIGVQGSIGAQGATGLQGVTGAQGNQGPTGLQGAIGVQGTTGLQGITGAQGATGLQGSTGPTGLQGSTGVQGSTGIQGATGIQGTTGLQGIQGATGVQGFQGTQGPGVSGTTNYVAKFTSGTTIGNSALQDDGTNVTVLSRIVGINGATEAGWGLKVYENSKIQNNNGTTILQLADTASGGKIWSLISSGTGNVHSVPNGTFYLRNSSDGLTALQVNSSGNVGIKMASNSYSLSIAGETLVQGNSILNYASLILLDVSVGGSQWAILQGFPIQGDFTIRESGVANHLVIKRTTGAATFSSSVTASQFLASSSGNAAIITSTGTNGYGLLAVGSSGGARDILLAGQSGYSNGFTVQFTGAEMRYTFLDGNVGINRTNPVSRLEVSSESEGSGFTGITVSNWALNQSRAGIAFKAYDWVQSAIWHGRGISGNLGGALVFGTNPNTSNLSVGGVVGRMWLFNNGNVSVGNEIDNGAKLQVSGVLTASSLNINVSSFGTDISVNSTIRVGSGFATQASIIFGDAGTPYWSVGRPAGSGNFSISSYALTALTIHPTTGNTGFGVSSPSHRIHASGNIYSTDTVFARNLKPEAFAGPVAGTPTGATIPLGYSSINISTPCDNNWRSIMSNINDFKGYFWVTLGDAASKDTANYFMAMTSPAYGVSSFGSVSYQDNGWNTGGFEFTYDNLGSGTHRLLVRCTSYYNSANTAYGTIYFLRLE